MTKIKSLDDLRQRKQQLEQSMDIREKDHPENLVQIKVDATCGIAPSPHSDECTGRKNQKKTSPLLSHKPVVWAIVMLNQLLKSQRI